MALLTTRERVLATAPELAAIPFPPAPGQPDVWAVALDDAALFTAGGGWGVYEEQAQRLYVAHVLLGQNPNLEKRQATSFTAGSVSKTLVATQAAVGSEDWWLGTAYGRRLRALLLSLGIVSVVVL